MTVKIIAEAGVNHNGDINIAKNLIEIAADCGADIVKFQSFNSASSISKSAKKARYQQQNLANSDSQLEMVKKLELSRNDHIQLIRKCEECGIEFLSTAFDIESLAMLKDLGAATKLKVPSGELTNVSLLRKFLQYDFEQILISTGMANLGEIEQALNLFLDYGVHIDKITLLHCTTEYPAPFDEINLKAMETLRDAFQINIGYSDHSKGLEVAFAAVALGAKFIEKHFTLDNEMEGPDHKASIEPEQLKALVAGIRNIEKALGSPQKRPTVSEISNKVSARKSIVANKKINAGEVFSEENIIAKRPGDGISADMWDFVLGKVARRKFDPDEKIEI